MIGSRKMLRPLLMLMRLLAMPPTPLFRGYLPYASALPERLCTRGSLSADEEPVCCPPTCSKCGGSTCGRGCCVGEIRRSGRTCRLPSQVYCIVKTYQETPTTIERFEPVRNCIPQGFAWGLPILKQWQKARSSLGLDTLENSCDMTRELAAYLAGRPEWIHRRHPYGGIYSTPRGFCKASVGGVRVVYVRVYKVRLFV